jgi:hypothetical protein
MLRFLRRLCLDMLIAGGGDGRARFGSLGRRRLEEMDAQQLPHPQRDDRGRVGFGIRLDAEAPQDSLRRRVVPDPYFHGSARALGRTEDPERADGAVLLSEYLELEISFTLPSRPPVDDGDVKVKRLELLLRLLLGLDPCLVRAALLHADDDDSGAPAVDFFAVASRGGRWKGRKSRSENREQHEIFPRWLHRLAALEVTSSRWSWQARRRCPPGTCPGRSSRSRTRHAPFRPSGTRPSAGREPPPRAGRLDPPSGRC